MTIYTWSEYQATNSKENNKSENHPEIEISALDSVDNIPNNGIKSNAKRDKRNKFPPGASLYIWLPQLVHCTLHIRYSITFISC